MGGGNRQGIWSNAQVPSRSKVPVILLGTVIGFTIIMVCAALVWIFLKVTGPPSHTSEEEARAECERDVINEMDSPAEVSFSQQTAKEVREREWVVAGKARSHLGGGHVIKADYNCTIAEGSLVKPYPGNERGNSWITITRR